MNIQTLIDNELALDKRETKSANKWKPSNLGRCYRLQYFAKIGQEPSDLPDPRNLRVMMVGKMFHKMVQDLIVKQDSSITTEVLAEDNLLKGYADIITTDENGGEVIDIKTVHSRSFMYLKQQTIAEDKYTNILQIMAYCKLLNKPKARLVFVSRDDFLVNEYGFYYEGKWQNEIERELNILAGIKELPQAQPRAYKNKKTGQFSDCAYCSFKTKCETIEKGGK